MTVLRRSAPTGATRVVCVIGDPVRHSLSPAIHNAAYEAMGLDWTYVAFPIVSGAAGPIVELLRAHAIEGVSVTMPHKDQVAALADEVSDDVRALGAANTLVRVGDRVRAEVTDGDGFVASLRADGIDVAGMRCCLLGAGGAGRAVALALGRAGASEVVVVNRDRARAELASSLAGNVGRVGSCDDVAPSELIINATSVGMGSAGGVPFDLDVLRPDHIVSELIYSPLETPLLKSARSRGCRTSGGVGMLVHQAVRQIRHWTGEDPPLDVMDDAARTALAARPA